MQNHDWIELFRLIPAEQHNTLVLTTTTGVDLSIEMILRSEMNYLVFRGRTCGSTDDGRVFFLPYKQIDFLQINRQVKEAEIRQLFGESPDEAAGAAATDAELEPAAPGNLSATPLPGMGPGAVVLPSAQQVANAPTAAQQHTNVLPTLAARLSTSPGGSAQGVTPRPRLSNSALNVTQAARVGSNVPAAALVPSGAANGNGTTDDAAPPRNSILDRLRAQRNSILPPRPPAR